MARIEVERDVPVETRDGVALATDVYRPSGEGEYPTLVQRIPYDKSNARSVGAPVFNPLVGAERGYVVVVQDTRGRGNSEGEFTPMRGEDEDGYDTIEWAADQPWCDGSVGIYGNSYLGVTARQAAVADPPHLEAALVYLSSSNYHEGWTYTGGAFELGFNHRWAIKLAGDIHDSPPPERVEGFSEEELERARADQKAALGDLEGSMSHLPLRDAPALREEVAPYYHEWLDHPDYDGYWESIDVNNRAGEISVPLLDVTGWYDLFLKGHLDMARSIRRDGKPGTRENHHLIFGPWAHETYMGYARSRVGDEVFGPDAISGAPFMSEVAFSWFDRWLKGEDDAIDGFPGVRYYDLGEREWREADEWPPEHTETEYYFHSGGNANSRFGDGRLREDRPDGDPPDSYEYDPRDPVPTTGGRIQMPELQEAGIKDQSGVEEREDVLVYTSPRLPTPVTIAGPVSVTLYASSSAPDTDFTAKLVDVRPDGYCANVAEGIVRGRYRNSTAEAEFVEPGEVYGFPIDLWAVAHTFDANHRLRVEISSSNFPRFDRNPNTDEPVAEAGPEDLRVAAQQVYHTREYPSHVTLPVTN